MPIDRPIITVEEGDFVTYFARVVIPSTGANLISTDVTSPVSYSVRALSSTTPNAELVGSTLTKVNTGTTPGLTEILVRDDLVTQATDAGYTKDDEGYNVKWTLEIAVATGYEAGRYEARLDFDLDGSFTETNRVLKFLFRVADDPSN